MQDVNGLSLLITVNGQGPYPYTGIAADTLPGAGECGLDTSIGGYNVNFIDTSPADHSASGDGQFSGAAVGHSVVITKDITLVDIASYTITQIDGDPSYSLYGAAPTAPLNVACSSGSSDEYATVTWDAPTISDTYKLYRNESDTTVGATEIDTAIADVTYNDTTGDAGWPYWYFVKATANALDSPFSASAQGFRRWNQVGAGADTNPYLLIP